MLTACFGAATVLVYRLVVAVCSNPHQFTETFTTVLTAIAILTEPFDATNTAFYTLGSYSHLYTLIIFSINSLKTAAILGFAFSVCRNMCVSTNLGPEPG